MLKRSLPLLLMLALLWTPVSAQDENPGTKGPANIPLGDGLAELKLPKGFSFIDKATTTDFLTKGGNKPDGNELGSIYLTDDPESFWVLMSYDPQGYVKDDEADDIDADELLESYKEGTEASNADRKAAGVPDLHVTGWGEAPHYDKATHHLIWGLTATSGADDPIVNFETRVLGREGVMSMTLICSPADLAKFKPKMDTLLANTTYKDGKRYADFKEGDKVSEAGLLALVAGGAAAVKLGLFAKLFKLIIGFFVLFKKGAILIVAAVASGAKKLFGGKGSSSNEFPAPAPTVPTSTTPAGTASPVDDRPLS